MKTFLLKSLLLQSTRRQLAHRLIGTLARYLFHPLAHRPIGTLAHYAFGPFAHSPTKILPLIKSLPLQSTHSPLAHRPIGTLAHSALPHLPIGTSAHWLIGTLLLASTCALCQPAKNYDTIWVGNPTRTVKIAFDIGLPAPPALDIGTKDYAGRVLGCCDVILKALITNPAPTSLYIRYGEKFYSGTIAYRANLSIDAEVLDFRRQEGLPDPINENRAITNESPSLEMQQVARYMGIMEGKTKDRINTIAVIKENVTFKLSDLVRI